MHLSVEEFAAQQKGSARITIKDVLGVGLDGAIVAIPLGAV
jgi:hypothetical protein